MIQSYFLAETADLLLEVSNTTPTEEKDVDTQGTRVQLLNKRQNCAFTMFIHF